MPAGRVTLAAVLAAGLLAGAQAEPPATEEGAASKLRLVSILGREVTNREGDGGRVIDVRLGGLGRRDATDWRSFATHPAGKPRWPLDAVLASPELTATRVQVIDSGTSDHRGIVTELAAVPLRRATRKVCLHRIDRAIVSH